MNLKELAFGIAKKQCALIKPLIRLFDGKENTNPSRTVSLVDLTYSISRKGRSLLRCANEENGAVKISTRAGAHLTSEDVLHALKLSDKHRRSGSNKGRKHGKDFDRIGYKEPASDTRQLISLAPRRAIMSDLLTSSRIIRRSRAVNRRVVREMTVPGSNGSTI